MKLPIIIILTNLIVGNGLLLLGGRSSSGQEVNYDLMLGMSVACIAFFLLFFKYSNYRKYSKLKLILISIISCMGIIFIGNSIALLINQPFSDLLQNIHATIFMGVTGNIIMLPISILLGFVNFALISFFKKL